VLTGGQHREQREATALRRLSRGTVGAIGADEEQAAERDESEQGGQLMIGGEGDDALPSS